MDRGREIHSCGNNLGHAGDGTFFSCSACLCTCVCAVDFVFTAFKAKKAETNEAHLNRSLESEQVEHEEATLTHDIKVECV